MSSPALYSPQALYSIAAVFTVLPIVFVGLRLYARRRINARLLWDDWLIVFALVQHMALRAHL